MGEQLDGSIVRETEHSETPAKSSSEPQHLEKVVTEDNLVYDNVEEEPEIHMRTWIALASMFLLNLVQVFALQGPPAVVSSSSWSILPSLIETAFLHRYQP
jgi:hypothetical protein